MICPNPICKYEWQSRVKNPQFCPRCHTILTDDARKAVNIQRAKYVSSHYVGTQIDGKHTVLKTPLKRNKPKGCELCGKIVRLSYHHWDNKNPSKGIWLCFRCHGLAESLDKDKSLGNKYLLMKVLITSEINEKSWQLSEPDIENLFTLKINELRERTCLMKNQRN